MHVGAHSEAEVTIAFEKAVEDWAQIYRIRGQPAGTDRADEELTKIVKKRAPESKDTSEAVDALATKAQQDAAKGVGAGLDEKKAEVDPRPMGYRELAKDIVSQVQSVAQQAFSEGSVDAKETTKRQRRAIQMLLTERLGEEETVKPDVKVTDEEKPKEKVALETEVKPGDVNVAVEDDEVFEVEEEIEATGAAAKSRAQVLSLEERKAELRARFAKAPARVRQL